MMARFYGYMQGNRLPVTRCGSKPSGIYGHLRGWNIGAAVQCFTDDTGADCVRVSLTRGSNGCGSEKCLGEFYINDKNAIAKKGIKK